MLSISHTPLFTYFIMKLCMNIYSIVDKMLLRIIMLHPHSMIPIYNT